MADDIPNADEIRRVAWNRDYFFGKKYRYEIKITEHPEAEPGGIYLSKGDILYEGTRELVIGRRSQGRSSVPICMVHFQQNRGEPHTDEDPLMTYFSGFDGKESRVFWRDLLVDFTNWNPNSSASVLAGINIAVVLDDPFLNALTPAVYKFDGIVDHEPLESVKDDFTIMKVKHTADRDALEFKSELPEGANLQYVVSSWPEYLTLESWDHNVTPHSKVVQGMSVSELVLYGNYRYPQKGKRVTYSQTQEFQLLEVTELDEAELASYDWFPPWPTGTVVWHEEQTKIEEIPFTSDQLKSIRARSAENLRSNVKAKKVPFVWINVGLAIAIIGLLLLRSWRQETVDA
ncbi:hypothetical protein Pla22_17020 [Rubripirellula amarantea]|uniref:Uncharacterized protein n=2 Tax=Rubripirellula amarantea TaxID=2527999 RepID=A0A5C5WTR0_9BACT|nr:hypothetical protein Pla22_17020 [Rubripirellula amarantea]